jgi:hypothetical protein
MAVIQMSDRDLARLRMLIDLVDGRLTLDAAGDLMGLGRRQVFRLRRAFAADGPSALRLASAATRAIDGLARPCGARSSRWFVSVTPMFADAFLRRRAIVPANSYHLQSTSRCCRCARISPRGPIRRHGRQHHHPSPSLRRRHKKGTQQAEALGRSRGGFSTKLHARCDARGPPLGFVVTPGQAHDIQGFGPLCRMIADRVRMLLADRARHCVAEAFRHRRCPCRNRRRRNKGRDPSKARPTPSSPSRPASVYAPQSSRAHVQQNEELAARRHALRQDRKLILRLRLNRCSNPLDRLCPRNLELDDFWQAKPLIKLWLFVLASNFMAR